jgi:hypothetical protein
MKHTRKANKKKSTRRKKNLVKKHTRKHKLSYRRKVQRGGDPFDEVLEQLTSIGQEINTRMKSIEEQNTSIKEIDDSVERQNLTGKIITDTKAINLIKKDIEKNYSRTIFDDLQIKIDEYAADNAELIKRIESKQIDEKFTEKMKKTLIEQAKNRPNDPSKVMDRLEEERRIKLAKIHEFTSIKEGREAKLIAISEKKNEFHQAKKILEDEIKGEKERFLDIFKENILLLGSVLFISNTTDPNDQDKFMQLNGLLLRIFKDEYDEIWENLKKFYKDKKKEFDKTTLERVAAERPLLATVEPEPEPEDPEPEDPEPEDPEPEDPEQDSAAPLSATEETALPSPPPGQTASVTKKNANRRRWRKRRKPRGSKTPATIPSNIQEVLEIIESTVARSPDAPPPPDAIYRPQYLPENDDVDRSVQNLPYNEYEAAAIPPQNYQETEQLWENYYHDVMPLIYQELKDINISLLGIFFTKTRITEESLQYFNFARNRIINLINDLNNNIFYGCWQGWNQMLGYNPLIDKFFDIFIINFIHSYRSYYPYRIRPGILNNLIYRILYFVFLIKNPINNNIQAGISYWMRYVFNSKQFPRQPLADTDLILFNYYTGQYEHPYH